VEERVAVAVAPLTLHLVPIRPRGLGFGGLLVAPIREPLLGFVLGLGQIRLVLLAGQRTLGTLVFVLGAGRHALIDALELLYVVTLPSQQLVPARARAQLQQHNMIVHLGHDLKRGEFAGGRNRAITLIASTA
jgi:hypothetical protein